MPPKGTKKADIAAPVATCTELALPDMFTPKAKGAGNHVRGNKHTENTPDTELSPTALSKRMSGKLATALKHAPPHVKSKWAEIQKLKGKRGGCIFKHKQEFLEAWVSDPSWAVPTDITLSKYCLYKALPV